MYLAKTEIDRLASWMVWHQKRHVSVTPKFGPMSVEITQNDGSGVGIASRAKCTSCGEQINITDYDLW